MSLETESLGLVCDVKPGFAFKSVDLGPNGVPVVRIGDIYGSGIVDGKSALRISAELLEERHKNFQLVSGDIVVSMTGEGKLGVVRANEPFLLNQRVARIRAKNTRDQRFVWHALMASDYATNFTQLAAGAAQQNLSSGQLESLRLAWPPIARDRERIANILDVYDDFIANNRRRIALLEQAARLLYDEWFVRLRFPGWEGVKAVDGVPEGWRDGVLADICAEHRDAVAPGALDAETPYIGLEHMPRRSIALSEWGVVADVGSLKLQYRTGDVLFGKIRPYFHKVGIAFTDGVSSSDAIVLRPREPQWQELMLMTVSSDAFVAAAAQGMKEGSKMPRADVKQMMAYRVLLPPDAVLTRFGGIVADICGELRNLTFQNRNLVTARDLLLPRLMSGALTV